MKSLFTHFIMSLCALSALVPQTGHAQEPLPSFQQRMDSLLENNFNEQAFAYAQKTTETAKAKKANALLAWGYYYQAESKYQMNQLDSCSKYMRKAIPLFEQEKDTLQLAKAYEYIANSMMYQTYNTDSSLQNIRMAYYYAQHTDTTRMVLKLLSNMATHFTVVHQIDSALHYIDIMQRLADQTSDVANQKAVAYLYWSLYRKVKDTDKAIAYLNIALDLLDTLIALHDTPDNKQQTQMKGTYYNFGVWTYNEAKRYREAVDWGLKALAFKEENGINSPAMLLSTYDVLGEAYYRMGQYDSAQHYLDSSLAWAKAAGRIDYEMSTSVTLAMIKAARNENGLAYCDRANEINQYYGNAAREFICECYYKQYAALGNKAKAFDYLEELMQITDSLAAKDSYQQIVQMEQRYKYEKQKQEIEQEKLLAQLEAQKQKRQGQYLLGGIGLLALSLGAGSMAFRKTRKYNRFLSEEDQRKDALMQEVHHRTNNSLQLISALLTMQGESVADNQLKQVLKDSESRIHSLSTLHQMLQEDAAHIQINMEEYLGNIADFHAAVLPEHVDIKTNFSRILLPAKTAMPLALIANELITNSLKYAFPNAAPGTIYFALNPSENEKEWVMEVSDNGVGMDQSEKDVKTNSSQVGSKLIAILVRQIGGTLSQATQNGTTSRIHFLDQKDR